MPRYHTDLEEGREEDKVGKGEGDKLERGKEREREGEGGGGGKEGRVGIS